MDKQETREVTTIYADGSTVTMTIDRKTGALLDYNATPPPPRNTDEGLQDLKSRMASIESSLADVKKADSGELEKRLGTLEGAVNKSNEQVATLKTQISQIDTLKTEMSQIEKNVSERLDLFGNGFNSYNDEKIHELETRVRATESENSELHHEIGLLTARLEALEQK